MSHTKLPLLPRLFFLALHSTNVRVLTVFPINHLYAARGRFIRQGRWLEMKFITG